MNRCLANWSRAFLLIGLIAAGPVFALDRPEDLVTGQVRYQLGIGEPLDALALNPQPSSPEQRLMRGQALAEIGLYRAARDELEALEASDDSVEAQAGLALVRLALRAQDRSAAQQWLDRVLPQLEGAARQEALFYQAELRRLRDDLSGAASILEEMDGGAWTGLGYYNLAAAYSARDQAVSRPLVALRVAAATTSAEADSPAAMELSPAAIELVDRSLLGAGLLALEEEDYAKAAGFFEKIRLDSYQAPRALYLHGVAQLKQNNVRAALQSWHRARKFPLAFPGTSEAYMAMGQGFDQAGSASQAADAFLAANAAFENERRVLAELDSDIQQQGAYAALIVASRQNDVAWFLDTTRAVTAPRLAWLMRYMEAPESQRIVTRLAELEKMDLLLEQHSADLEVMRQSVERRLEKVQSADAAAQTDADVARLRERAQSLQLRAAELQRRFDSAVAARRMDVLVSGELGARLRHLDVLAEAARHHDANEALERIRRLRGLTLWQAQKNIDRDRESLETGLANVRDRAAQTEAAIDEFHAQAEGAPERFEGFLERIESAASELEAQRARLTALRERSDAVLTRDLREFISGQIAQLQMLEQRSEQEIAHLYDYMAVSRLKTDQRNAGQRNREAR